MLDHRSIHITLEQLVADEPIAIRSRRVNCEQDGDLALIDFIDTQDAGKFLDDPGLVISHEVKVRPIGVAPLTNTGFTGTDPKIARKPIGDATHRHPIVVDCGNGGGDDTIGVAGIGTEERRLGAKVMATRDTEMDADSDE